VIPAPRRWVMVGCLQGRRRENAPKKVNKPLTLFTSLEKSSEAYFGIGMETALPVPRSAIQSTSPAGSTAVGVFRPSFSTVI